ncbi:hypothetical protein SAMN05444162_2967 [Paenibacillaceae bacterium GAS479]|nr:hypothetical protein SAMN05444162_2967 [Paenibacillaceae bacterium GAS479]
MKKKSAILGILTLLLAVFITASAAPVQTLDPGKVNPAASVFYGSSKGPGIAPREIGLNIPLTPVKVAGETQLKSSFKIEPGFGHLKLTFYNRSSEPLKVTLEHKDTNKNYFGHEIPANSEYTWISFMNGFDQGMRGGNYIIQWLGGKSDPQGIVYVKTAIEMADLAKV